MSAPFTELQSAVETLLESKAYFSAAPAITVITEKIGDIESKIALQLGKIGIVALVVTPVGPVENPEHPVAMIRPLLVVTIIEHVLINRSARGTQQPADKVAMGVMHYLHQQPEELGYMLTVRDFRLQPDAVEGNDSLVAYSVVFQVETPIAAEEPTR